MRTVTKLISIFVLLALVLTGCRKDNYDEPESFIQGRVVYEGKPLQLAGNEKVTLQLYQPGYEKHDPFNVHVNQNGEFSICIFDGHYQLITKSGNGPWTSEGRDTIDIDLNGFANLDVEVVPYYLVENASITLNGNKVNASFDVKKIGGNGIDRVFVVLGTTQFLNDEKHNVDRYDVDQMGNYKDGGTFIFDEKDYTDHQMFKTALNRGTLFARIGLWPTGSDQAIYSEVVRLK